MKVRTSIRRICKDCKETRRRSGLNKKGRKPVERRIVCKNPKHKQRQG